MQGIWDRFWEFVLGLDKGFLGKQGDFSVQFNQTWPWQHYIGKAPWNLLLAVMAGLLVWYVYRREGRSRPVRIVLGALRALLLAFLIALINKPVLTLSQNRTEPSYLAFLLDNSASMQVKDAGSGPEGGGISRFDAVVNLLSGEDQKLVRGLAKKHILKFYTFGQDAQGLTTVTNDDFAPGAAGNGASSRPTTRPAGLSGALASVRPDAQVTQVLGAVKTVLQDMQGKRLAGVVVLTDGRDTGGTEADVLKTVQAYGARIYPVAVGSLQPPRNIVVEGIDVQDAAFAKDIVSAKVHILGKGYPAGHVVKLTLKNKATGLPLLRGDGKPAEVDVKLDGQSSQTVEVTFKPTDVGTLDFIAEASKQAGEVNDEDNTFPAQVAVLDAKIAVLYVEGYPRWEYRYLKNEMIRDRTVDIACLLYSADRGFAQEGDPARPDWNGPVKFFPESITQMMQFDVVIFGDVDPRQFTDAQLQLVADFVNKKFGGFGMIAGPRYAPYAYRNTPIESILPVAMSRTPPEEGGNLTNGWRPILTKDGQESTIFRFFEDKAENQRYIAEDLQPLFWYSRGISAKSGAGVVYAEHPFDTGPDGRKAPLLVLGHSGGGRTLFSAIDDSWRWRYYTGESIFDTYWVQQLRYLATAKKLGQRRFTLNADKPAYERGNLIKLNLRVLGPDLLQQLPEQIGVTIVQRLRNPDGTESEQTVRQENLTRQPQDHELYSASWTADRTGQFEARVPALGTMGPAPTVPIVVKEPHLELQQPEVDRRLLSMLPMDNGANDPGGVEFEKLSLADDASVPVVRAELARIPSAAMIVPELSKQPLWNAPLAMVIFVLLITLEWVLRKGYGML